MMIWLAGAAVIRSALAGAALALSVAAVNRTGAPAPAASDAARTPAIAGVVAGGTVIEPIQTWDTEFGGEGPIATPDGGILFAQQDANRILKVDPDGSVSTFLEGTNRTTGLAFDHQGRLLGTGAIPPAILVLAPTRSVLVDHFENRKFLRPKHLVVKRAGGLYFTDLLPVGAQDRGPKKPAQQYEHVGPKPAVFYVHPDGRAVKASEEIPEPNGIMLSPDEKTLYVTNLPGEFVYAFDTHPGGALTNIRRFAAIPDMGEPSRANGMAIDATGRLYVAAVGGVHVFSPQGTHLGTIPFAVKPGNLAFSGPGKRTLYVIGRGVSHRIAMLARGFEERAK